MTLAAPTTHPIITAGLLMVPHLKAADIALGSWTQYIQPDQVTTPPDEIVQGAKLAQEELTKAMQVGGHHPAKDLVETALVLVDDAISTASYAPRQAVPALANADGWVAEALRLAQDPGMVGAK